VIVRDFGDCRECSSNQYALSLYTLAESVKATSILEIGAGWGWSARAFSLSLENRLPSKLVSVDINPQRMHRENRRAVLNTSISWDILDTDSTKVVIDGEFDVLYIDGDPYLAQADFLRFYPKVRPGGFVVMDGYGGQVGPTEAVDSLSSSYPFITLPYHSVYAHAVHRKPKPLLVKDGFSATCDECRTVTPCRSWCEVDTAAREHTNKSKHRVHVRVEPRDLSYTVIPK
jgi:hypothetical protein